MNRSHFLVCALALVLTARVSYAQQSNWDSTKQGDFVVSLSRDVRGEIWAGTEDNGVSHFSGGKWTSYQTKDGLGDNDVYAIAGDRLERVWVGHRGHGVSVWNGTGWKNYGRLLPSGGPTAARAPGV